MTDRRCVVVGYDGSDPARAAVAYAAKRAGRGGRVVVVYASSEPWRGSQSEQDALRGKVLDVLLVHSGDVLSDVDFELAVVAGRPADAIAAVARRLDADEIAVGARGRAPGPPPDSVSEELRRIADRPLTIVPYGTRSAC
jgi:nucleotide-binding universal stress UspA family protein